MSCALLRPLGSKLWQREGPEEADQREAIPLLFPSVADFLRGARFGKTREEQGLREGQAPGAPSRTRSADDSTSRSLALPGFYSRSSADRQFL